MNMMRRTAFALGLAAAVCATTPLVSAAAPMDSQSVNCDGARQCDTPVWTIGGGNAWIDYDFAGLPSSSVSITVLRNGLPRNSCTHTIHLLGGSASGTFPCDFGPSTSQIKLSTLAQVSESRYRIGWHQ